MKHPRDILLILALAAGIFLWQRTTFDLWHIDLFHIQLASYAWHVDQPDKMYTDYGHYDLWVKEWYRPQADRLGAWGDENAYFYPPFVAGIFAPVSDVHVYVWRNVLLAINILLLFGFAWQITRLIAEPATWRGLLWALALVLITYPMARASKLAQIVPLLAFLFWEGVLRLKSSRLVSSALIGSVIAVKIFPAGWMLIPLARQKWKTIFSVGAIVVGIYGLSVLTMGLGIHLRWWAAVKEFGSVVYTFFGNQSPAGWFTRAVLGHGMLETHFAPTLLIESVRLIFTAIFLGGTALILWKNRMRELPAALENGLMLSGLMLALPVTWEHYFLFALPAFGTLIYAEWQRVVSVAERGRPRPAGIRVEWPAILLAVATFFFTMKLTRFYADDPVGKIISGSQCFGLILFWIYCIFEIVRPRKVTLLSV
jgi:hypothetical protein